MKNFNLHVLRDQNVFQLKVEPLIDSYEYSLYIVVKDSIGKFNIIKRYWYGASNDFLYISDNSNDYFWFHYFVRDKDKNVVFKKIVNFNYQFRDISRLDDIGFDSSFDSTILLDYKIPVKYQKNKNTNKHIILLNGALGKGYKRYPIYHRCSWSTRFACNMLNIYDASLNQIPDYLLAWYQGTEEKPLLPDIIKIVEHLKVKKNINNRDIVFYGSSAGGWTALKLSEYFQGSTAVAINAQINILEYVGFAPKSMDVFLRNAFNGKNIEDVKKLYLDRLTINWKKFQKTEENEEASRFIYAQNIVDRHHYENHFSGFWRNFSMLKDGWDIDMHNYSITYEDSNGHGSEPLYIFDKIIDVLGIL